MGFAIFFFIAWLVTGIFVVIPKKLSLIENTFLFLLMLSIIINFSWITIEELKWLNVTKNTLDYTAFLLNRSISLPLILLIEVNLFQKNKTVTRALVLILSTVVIMLGISFLGNHYHILTYQKWNYGLDAIYYVALQMIAVLVLIAFRKITKDAVSYS